MDIKSEIISIINEAKLTTAPTELSSNLYTDLGFDSLAFARLLVNIEEAYSISIRIMEMGMCIQVEKLIALVENKIKERENDSSFTC